MFRLREENVNQREELDQLKSFVLKEMRMKYKGCNHPTKEIIQFKKKKIDLEVNSTVWDFMR